jgi:hypothetical protein
LLKPRFGPRIEFERTMEMRRIINPKQALIGSPRRQGTGPGEFVRDLTERVVHVTIQWFDVRPVGEEFIQRTSGRFDFGDENDHALQIWWGILPAGVRRIILHPSALPLDKYTDTLSAGRVYQQSPVGKAFYCAERFTYFGKNFYICRATTSSVRLFLTV